MFINNISVTNRHNRPSVLGRTALVSYFFNDGQYADPYQISAVSVFRSANNFYPSSVLESNNNINSDSSSLVLANFANSASLTSDSSFDPSNYSVGASGIYRLREGVYAVVLDSVTDEYNFNLSGNATIPNGVSATGDYIDVWTLKRVSQSNLDSTINKFTLHSDRFFNTTEPLLFRVSTRLENNHIQLGSKTDLKFTNEFTIENVNIDRSIINLFKDSLIMDAAIEIVKDNTDRNLPARVSVSSFAETSSLVDVTSDNTCIFTFDTSVLTSHPAFLNGTFGPLTGTYAARLRFTAVNQVIYSNYFGIILR